VDEAARRALLAWYRAHRRDLPWRRTADPYAIWVSEAMLQQTRVDVATPYYERWMRRFPTLRALAVAREDEVLGAWSGLGYYLRARNLHAAAKQVAVSLASMPTTAEGLRALPGVGPYTAAAVASIAHGEAVACVDGNVVRVVARVAGITGPIQAAGRRQIEGLAQQWLDPRAAGDWNQAMMELGATVCTPRAPDCTRCPVAGPCASAGLPQAAIEAIPGKAKPAAAPRPDLVHVVVVRRGGHVLLVRRPSGGLLGGMLGLPSGARTANVVASLVQAETGVRVEAPRGAAVAVRHQFSHRTWDMRVRTAAWRSGEPRSPARWVAEAELAGAPLPAAMRKALRAAGVEA